MEANKKGFLKSDFEVFYINDCKNYEFEYHFHDFHKIIIFLNGDVNYIIEGRNYLLRPYDVLWVRNSEIHKPVINSQFPYERLVIWIKQGKISPFSHEIDFLECLCSEKLKNVNLLRLEKEIPENILNVVCELKKSFLRSDFAQLQMKKLLVLQFLIYINRIIMENMELPGESHKPQYDITVASAIDYINRNLSNDLSVEKLSEQLFVSKYHLMRKFKQNTGYTMHNFILKKRLIKARELIESGKSVMWSSLAVGFNDYSTFVRAYKKMFNELPRIKNKLSKAKNAPF